MNAPDESEIKPSGRPDPHETWSTHHLQAPDSTVILGLAQTASLPLGRGNTKVYSTGDIIDNSYRLLSLLGSGGMGVVFRCQHVILGKEYALKLLAADKLSADSWMRFKSEAKALARLNHPGVVGIHNMGVDSGECPYYVMDLLEGQSLSQLVKSQKRLSVAQALGIFIQLADALDAAHQQGIIHRDIKPSNVMIVQDARGLKVKLVDFGIARLSNRGMGSQNNTAAGTVFGTPYYMSPEQGLGQMVDERTDIYSLGCALFEALTSIPPFRGNNAMETLLLHQTEDAPLLNEVYSKGNFSESLEACVNKMLKRSLDERYANMKEVRRDLMRIADGKTIGIEKSLLPDVNPEPKQAVVQADASSRSVGDRGKNKSARSKEIAPANSQLLLVIGAAAALLLFVAAGSLYVFYKAEAGKQASQAAEAADAAADDTHTVSMDPFHDFAVVIKKFLAKHDKLCFRTVDAGGRAVKRFVFPDRYYLDKRIIPLGYLRTEDGVFHRMEGTLDVPVEDHTFLYLQCMLTPYPDIFERFGKDNISGLEIVTFKVPEVLASLKGAVGLTHLSLFNSVERADGIDCSTLLKEHVPLLDQVTGLKSLGLCGELCTEDAQFKDQVLGSDLVQLKLLSSLDTLALQEIRDVQPLLEEISKHPNIKNLTLVRLELKDQDMKILSRCKSLESLTIFKCPEISPASAASFSKMPALKSLHMDDNWTDIERKNFQHSVQSYVYENYKTNTHN